MIDSVTSAACGTAAGDVRTPTSEPHRSAAASCPGSEAPLRDRTPEDWALEARAGSRAAFEHLVVRFQRPLYRFLLIRTRSREDAEELTQEAFLRAWCKLDQYQPRWSFSTWLFAVARRLAQSHARRGRTTASLTESFDAPRGGADPHGEACAREERVVLWETAARVLSEEQRSALWLRYAEELSIEEVARVLGKLQTSVRVLLFRAREKLADAMQDARPASRASANDVGADDRRRGVVDL